MDCNNEIDKELENIGQIYCPVCNEQLQEHTVKNEQCCKTMKLETDNGEIVWVSCDLIQGYKYVNEYTDSNENKFKIMRNSILYRKYHIQKVIFDICSKDSMQITTIDKNKIFEIFEKIESVLPQINGYRKRMIKIDFILKQILMMMTLQYKNYQFSNQKEHQHFISNTGVELEH